MNENGVLPANIIDRFCYYYEYDARKRLIKKKLPGADPILYVYDNRDRLVLSQDGNQKASNPNQYTIRKYDDFNRLIYSAEFVSTYNYSDLEYHINNGRLHGIYSEVNESNKYLENSWDSYPDWVNDSWSFNTSPGFENSAILFPNPTENKKGLLTASRERTLLPNGNFGGWLATKYFYDEKGRLIQGIS